MTGEKTKAPHVRWWDPLAALLLLCALLTAAGRLVVTSWTEDLQLVQTVTLLGAVLGLVLGQTRFPAKWAFFFAAAYAAFIIPWQMGYSIHLAAGAKVLWGERMLIVIDRMRIVIEELSNGRPVSENILFVLLMSVMFWALSVHAGYSLNRHGSAWRAALPTGLGLMVIHAYDPVLARRAWFLAAYLLFSLLMVARMAFTRQRHSWREKRIYMPPDIGFDWIRFTLVAAVLLVVFAWTAPALAETLPAAADAWSYIRRPYDRLTNNLSNVFDNLQATVGVFNEYYGDSFSLTLGNSLSEEPVMEVEAPPRSFAGMRYYWRAYAYDNYDDGKWTSTAVETRVVRPDAFDLEFPSYQGRLTGTFVFRPEHSVATLYTVPQPIWVSQPATAYITRDASGTVDIIALQALPSVSAGDSYEVRASLTAVTQAALREAGTEYPAWVTERYLQLPDNITPRTRELAEKIRGDHDNPYDIAQAVTEYLRTYEYTESIQPPPRDKELVDWWLFEYGEGFCQYYATAEVVLLRSLGIPARWAVGYAEGEFVSGPDLGPPGGTVSDPEDNRERGGTYLVRERDRHTWPEVYFPGIGWVEFEPTAGQPEIVRPSGERRDNPGASNLDEGLDEEEERARLEDLARAEIAPKPEEEPAAGLPKGVIPVAIGVAGLGLAFAAVFVWRRRQPAFSFTPLPVRLERSLRKLGLKPPAFISRWAQYASLSPLTHAYLEINRALRRLGKPPKLSATPYERAAALAGTLPEVEPAVDTLLREYQHSLYSQKSVDQQAARNAGREIRSISIRTVLRSLFSGRLNIK